VGTRHERVSPLHGAHGPTLVYAMELDDPEKERRTYQGLEPRINREHREVMGSILIRRAEAEELLDLREPRKR
jgi:hypothetical protein